jgi:hypothetical protein
MSEYLGLYLLTAGYGCMVGYVVLWVVEKKGTR